MKLLVLSDLHVELAEFRTASIAYDCVILAGDIHSPGSKVVPWARRQSVFGPDVPIVVVPGNHEYYNRCMQTELALMREAAGGTNVVILEGDELVIPDPHRPDRPGLRILGTTLWTDFCLPVVAQGADANSDVAHALQTANRRLNDFRAIDVPLLEISDGRTLQVRHRMRALRAEDTLAMHWIARDWLRRKLDEPFDGPTVVVTHHAPTRRSVAPKYADDWLSPAFVSELPVELFKVPTLWVHGHTHTGFDYQVGNCRVVSNPRGYRLSSGGFENPGFDAAFVVEVA